MTPATLDAAPLHHERRGPAGAAPVLFLHGLASCGDDWAMQVPDFEARHRVLTVDLPGHGRSPSPAGPLTVEGMARAVAVLLARLDEPPAHVVGLSLGAAVALRLALQAPARVRTLTLVNGFARLRPGGPRRMARLLARVALLAAGRMDAVAAQVARQLFPWPEQEALRRMAVASLGRMDREAYLALVRALAAFDARGQLAAVRRPTLVVAGDRDRTVPLAAAAALARGIPGARLLVVPGSGHATPCDQPARFNRAVLEFIGGH